MKSMLILLLMLVLTGCGADAEETPIPTTEPPAAVTEPSGSYHPGSTLEMFTEGAVRAYPQNIPDLYAIAAAGSDVLVFSGRANTTITRLTGQNLFRIAERTLDVRVNPEDPSTLITADRMVYFDENSRELVWLDENFREFSRLKMPEDMVGTPVITADRLTVWYCTADGLRMMDVESGISRLVKQMSAPEQTVTGLLMGDTVVELGTGDGTMYLDAATGSLLEAVKEPIRLASGDGMYWGSLNTSFVFGTSDSRTRQLFPADPNGETTLLSQSGSAVTYGCRENRWQLDYYDLTTGHRTAQTYLPESVSPWQYAIDGQYLYFLTLGEAESQILCRWDMGKSLTGDETDYSDIFYTREAPDTAGLAKCAQRAAALSGQYGVNIRIYEDALETGNPAYAVDVCWQVGETEKMLDSLESLLATLPENFLPLTMKTREGTLYIDLLGSVQGMEADLGGQFWQNQDAHILLSPGENFASAFFHGLFHTMETRLLSKSNALYRWDELNPKGFAYDLNFEAYLTREGGEYLDDNATRAFTDSYAMSFPREDQARVFEFACLEGNEDFFRSAIMQKKLRAVCTGIRESWGLKKSPDTFLWEQYLESPLAYTGK